MAILSPQALDRPLSFNWCSTYHRLPLPTGHADMMNSTGSSSLNFWCAVSCMVLVVPVAVPCSFTDHPSVEPSTIFFLFYFNRVFAKIVSVALRAYLRTWGGSPVYIDIQSLQISLLAGRIFFGRVRYHGSNETIQIVSGHITWRYWLRKVRHCHGDKAGSSKANELPSRIAVKLNGLEWFVYNRSPAYDAIWAQMEESVDTREGNATSTVGSDEGSESRNNVVGEAKPDSSAREGSPVREKLRTVSTDSEHNLSRSDDSDGENGDRAGEFLVDSFFLRLLPVRIDCHRGGVVMGNNNTPTILVTKFRDADGIIDATPVLLWLHYQIYFVHYS